MPYRGKHSRTAVAGKHGAKPKGPASKTVALALSLALVAGVGIGGTLAWLNAETGPVVNTFTTACVPNEPVEEFNGTVKKSIEVKNTGDIAAYVRVKLVTYRVDANGNHIGGTATIPEFTLGDDWFKQGEYYYYKLSVSPQGSSGNLLKASIELQEYTDADGGKQVIEVISESIQSVPADAVETAWKVEVGNDGNLTGNAKTTQAQG